MIRPKPQDLVAVIINHGRATVGLKHTVDRRTHRAARSRACMMQASVMISTCPSSTVLQEIRIAALRTNAAPKMIGLGLEVLESGNSGIIESRVRPTPPIYVVLLGMGPQSILCWLRLQSRCGIRKDLIRCDLHSSLGN
jgi:hypothetical protein